MAKWWGRTLGRLRSERGLLGGGRRKIIVFRKGCDVCEDPVYVLGGRPVKHLPMVNAMVAHFPVDVLVHTENALPEIERIDDDLVMHTICRRRRRLPRPDQTIPWGVNRVHAPQAWALSRGQGVKVAVLDTGIDLDHPDLQGNVAGGHNVLDPGKPFLDDNGHGTHVAGTIAALDNALGVVGVAPGAQLYGVKALDRYGSGFLSDLIEGIDWCIHQGIQLINLSLGTREDNQTFRDAIQRAHAAGVLMVAAAGNEGGEGDTVNFPARYPETLAVSAIDQAGQMPRFASRGPAVDLLAPGVAIPSTWPGGGYRDLDGTSMAAPHATAIAALVMAIHPGLGPDQIKERLLAGVRRLPGLPWGLADAARSAAP